MYSCAECANLDKEIVKRSADNHCYNYGCAAHGFTCVWCRTDNELKTQGCSDFTERKEEEQISIFD